jgi:hypothetical protein
MAGLPVWGLAAMIVFIKIGGRGFWMGTTGIVIGVLLAGDLVWVQKSSFLIVLACVQLVKVLAGAKLFSGPGTAFWAGLVGGCAAFGFLGRMGIVVAYFFLSLLGGYALNVGSLANYSMSSGSSRVVENARTGYRAVTYKVYFNRAGEEIARVELCQSTYPSSGRIIERGP